MEATAIALWVVIVVVVVLVIAALGHLFGWWSGGHPHPDPDENVSTAVQGFFGFYGAVVQDNTIEDVRGSRLTIGPGRADVWMPPFRRRAQQQQN